MLSCSTSWNALTSLSGKEIVREIKQIGFNSLEINYQVSEEKVKEILQLHQQGEISVSSLHNISPLAPGVEPVGSHKAYPLNHPDKEERDKGINLTKKTIDYACLFGAGVVVLHLGESFDTGLKELENQYRTSFKRDHRNLDNLKCNLKEKRKKFSESNFKVLEESLKPILEYAQKKYVKLGIENRYYFSQIPDLQELEIILDKYPAEVVGYWHDVGHSQSHEYLELTEQDSYLKKFNDRMLGIHLMDAIEDKDHLAPGMGNLRLERILGWVDSSRVIKTIEVNNKVTQEELQKGREFLISLDFR